MRVRGVTTPWDSTMNVTGSRATAATSTSSDGGFHRLPLHFRTRSDDLPGHQQGNGDDSDRQNDFEPAHRHISNLARVPGTRQALRITTLTGHTSAIQEDLPTQVPPSHDEAIESCASRRLPQALRARRLSGAAPLCIGRRVRRIVAGGKAGLAAAGGACGVRGGMWAIPARAGAARRRRRRDRRAACCTPTPGTTLSDASPPGPTWPPCCGSCSAASRGCRNAITIA